MSRRRSRTTKIPSARPEAPVAPVGSWLTFFVGVLVVARYFVPAESAALGETLWIVQFWLMGAVVWQWLAARNEIPRRRFDRLDVAICLLIGGHVLSAVVVLAGEGDRRAALNMLWEWVGIGTAMFMIREVVQRPAERTRLLSLVVVATITLSGLGIWQHHVWYPSVSSKLREFDELRATPATSRPEAQRREQRLIQLRRELGAQITDADQTSSQLMRARVAASTEPIGRFALANTFAGLLVVGLLLATWQLHGLRLSEARTWRWIIAALLLLATAYCFWLTKSRTALLGLLAGLFVWGGISWRARRWSRGIGRATLIVAIGLVGLPLIASFTGGLDRQVVTEAPKSLQYRWEYWTATGAVICEAPLLGVGPGNFRQAYLKHKLPGSSEEVLDPHNLLLDVWANGGLLAVSGLLLLIAIMGREIWRLMRLAPATAKDEEPNDVAAPVSFFSRPGIVCGCIGLAGLAVAWFVSLMSGSGDDGRTWMLAIGWCVVCLIWPVHQSTSQPVIGAALVALLTHLLGAGGIAMPAITQTLLLLAACLVVNPASNRTHRIQPEWSALPQPLPWRPMATAGLALCLAMACAFSATLPVSSARTQTAIGRAILAEGGDASSAIRSFEAAIDADPLAAEPWQDLAMAHATAWRRLASSDSDAFDNAVKAQREAIRLNPRSATAWRLLGDLWWGRYQTTVDRAAADQALRAYGRAAALYPHQARLQAHLAMSARAASSPQIARQAARKAIHLDDANRKQGHIDRYLPDAVREEIENIAGAGPTGL